MKDWLAMTHWHDEVYRSNELHRYRSLATIKKEQATKKTDQARLLDDCDNLHGRNDHQRSGVGFAKGISRASRDDIPASSSSAPRVDHHSNQQHRRERDMARTHGYAAYRSRSVSPCSMDRYYNSQYSEIRPPRRGIPDCHMHAKQPHSSHYVDHRQNFASASGQNQVTDYFSHANRRQYPPTHDYHPMRIDLGSKGGMKITSVSCRYHSHLLTSQQDSRFFIIKSVNYQNVQACKQEGIWATKAENGELLADAFMHTKNVILFFSVNGSRAYQGYVSTLLACHSPQQWNITAPC